MIGCAVVATAVQDIRGPLERKLDVRRDAVPWECT